jgi:hypothetical protein
MLVEPGFFRTELLIPESTSYAEATIDDYAQRTAATVTAWNGVKGRQGRRPCHARRRTGPARWPR